MALVETKKSNSWHLFQESLTKSVRKQEAKTMYGFGLILYIIGLPTTTHQRSCGKEMFSVVSVCHSVHR